MIEATVVRYLHYMNTNNHQQRVRHAFISIVGEEREGERDKGSLYSTLFTTLREWERFLFYERPTLKEKSQVNLHQSSDEVSTTLLPLSPQPTMPSTPEKKKMGVKYSFLLIIFYEVETTALLAPLLTTINK